MIRDWIATLARRKVLTVGLAVAAAVCLAVGGYAAWLLSPPPLPRTLPEAVALAKSARYQRLDAPTRAQYLQRMQNLFQSSDPENRRAIWEQVRDDPEARQALGQMTEEMMGLRLQAFAKADAAGRRQILDEAIDQWEARRTQMANRPATRPAGERGPGPGGPNGAGGDRMARMRERMQKGNPQQQALMREFMRAMQERRRERGLPAIQGPGGMGGGRP